nr:MAG TPA: hypothetical protein [Caudoviricetes sp.]
MLPLSCSYFRRLYLLVALIFYSIALDEETCNTKNISKIDISVLTKLIF